MPPAVDTSLPPTTNVAEADNISTSDIVQPAHSTQQEEHAIAVAKSAASMPSIAHKQVDPEGTCTPTNKSNDDTGTTVNDQAASPSNILPLSLALGCATPNFMLRKSSNANETQRRQRIDNDPQPNMSAEVASSNSQISTRLACSLEANQLQAGQVQPMETNAFVGNVNGIQLSSSASDAQGDTIDKGIMDPTQASVSPQKSASSKINDTPVLANTDAPNSEQIPAISTSNQSTTSSVGATLDTKKYFGRFFRGMRRYMYATNANDGNGEVSQLPHEGVGTSMSLSCHEAVVASEKYPWHSANAKTAEISSQDTKHATVSMSTSTFEESDATMPAKGFGRWRDIPDLPPIMSSLSMQSAGTEPSYRVAASRHHLRRTGLKKNDQSRNDRWAMKDMGRERNRKRCVYSILKNICIVINYIAIGAVLVLVLVKKGVFLPVSHLGGTAPTMQPTPALVGLVKFEERDIDLDEGIVNRESMFVPSSAPSISPTLPTLNFDLIENDGGGQNIVVETDSLPSNLQTGSPQPRSPTQSPSIAPNTVVPTMIPSTKAISDSLTESPSSSPMLYNSPSAFPGTSTSVSPSRSPTQSPSIAPNTIFPTMIPSTKAISDSLTESPSSSPMLYNSPSAFPGTSTSVSPSRSPTQSPSIAPNTIFPTMIPSTKAILDSPTESPSSSSMLYNSPSAFPGTSTSVSPSHEKDSQIISTNTYCSQMSVEDQYKSHLTREIDETTLSYLLSLDMFNLSWRMKVELNGQKMTTERFGPDNEFSAVVRMAALRTLFFWTRRGEEEDIGGSLADGTPRPRTVKIAGTHSSDIDGLVELGLAFVQLHGKTAEEGIEEARRVAHIVETQVPGGFDNPIFTMHGFAYDVSGEAGVILGDGMLDYLQNIPVPTRVPFTIALHSRLASIIGAHLLHLNLGMPTVLPSDEGSNTYQALFADALGAYYMAHPLGGLLTGNEICTSFLAYVRSTGVEECDSSVERNAAPGIQLTSSQKSCAAIWAIRWAWVDNATAKSDSATGVASLSELKDRFDARYQRILNVDQLGTCPELSTFECTLY